LTTPFIENLNLSREGVINIAGALLFGKNIEHRLPAFIVKCVTYPNIDIDEDEYIDSRGRTGAGL